MKKQKIKRSPQEKHKNKQNSALGGQLLSNWYTGILGLAVISLLGIISYSNSFNCSFHFDDEPSIIINSSIRNLSDLNAIWNYSHTRFVSYLTFALNYHFDQLNVWGYHLVNLMIHLINACLVYWLAYLIFSSPALKDNSIAKDKKVIAFFTALLFVSHPLATQSVTYIVQRMSSLAALFYLLSLVLYMKARFIDKNSTSKYLLFAGSLFSALLAMLTKENAFTLPFAIVLVELFFLQTRKRSVSFKDYRVILIILGLLSFIGWGFYRYSSYLFNSKPLDPDIADKTITSANYLLTQFSVILKYIQLLFLPIRQNVDYHYKLANHFFDQRTLLSFFVLVSLLTLATFLFKKHRILSFGIFWFFLTLSIESSIIPLQDLIFEHRTYLPSFGFFLIVSYGIYLLLWNTHKSIGIALLVMMVGSYSFLTYERNKVWKDEFTLWTDAISKSPNKARPYTNRGNNFMDENKLDEAFRDFNKAIALNPKSGLAYYNRGNIYEKEKKYTLAMDDYNAAIQFWPEYYKTYNNRGNIFKYQNRMDRAMEDYSMAIELNPEYYQAYSNRGSIYILLNKNTEAIADLNKAIELKSDCAEAYGNRGLAEWNLGEKEKCCQDLKTAVELGFEPAIELYDIKCR